MSMIMNHDITSLMGQRLLQKNSLAMRRSLEKLSTGLRTKIADIDNTAGLAISETMRSRIYGMDKAIYNTQDGISMIQTAAASLDNTQSMLRRMRELTVQASNDVLTQQDRSYIQVEINEIRDQITRVTETTQFNRKKILSGDNAVLWSSTNNDVKAVINGGLRSIDNYGQKYAIDGNYKISVKADPGKAQVQKSNIFHVKNDSTAQTSSFINSASYSGNLADGEHNFTLAQPETQNATITGSYNIGGYDAEEDENFFVDDVFTIEAGENLDVNANILFEVVNVDENNNVANLKATANILSQDGTSQTKTIDNILLAAPLVDEEAETSREAKTVNLFGDNSLRITLNNIDFVSEGSKFTVNVSAQNIIADNATAINFDGNTYIFDGDAINNRRINFSKFEINPNGEAMRGTFSLETANNFSSLDSFENNGEFLARVEVSSAGKIADGEAKLRDVQNFYDSDGNFLLSQPQTLTLTQGDGTQARITLYADDTLKDAARKLNDAIANGLGQANYTNDATKFVSFVDGAASGLEAVEGTLVMRSGLAGRKGEISISGSEEVLKALGLNTIQESKETEFTVSIRNAHDNMTLAENVKATGNKLIGVIHKNVDIEFSPMLGVIASWNENTKSYDLVDTSPNTGAEAVLHLADNTTIFQTGAGEGEDVMIAIGDMSAHALGLDDVNVMNINSASRSLTIIDSAIDRVSMQMAKLGGAQNRLEHHLENLKDETEQLTAANSNIRDTEYMSEMMEYTRISILMESNAVMLAQSNEMQRSSILRLLG